MREEPHVRESFLRRTAKEIRGYNQRMKLLGAMLLMLLVIAIILYVVSALYSNSGSFTVAIDKTEMTKYGLSLSESREMTHLTSQLNAKISEGIINMASEELPPNLDEIDGAHSGENYIAYTFYLQNRGEVAVQCEYSVDMSNITSGLDEAIRLRLYVDGVPTTYAKTKRDGTGAEPNTTAFYSSTVMTKGRTRELAPGEVAKFTVVLWLEGSDPECLDQLIGGTLKAEMKVNIVH